MEASQSPAALAALKPEPVMLPIYLGDETSCERCDGLLRIRASYRDTFKPGYDLEIDYLPEHRASLLLQGMATFCRLQREYHWHQTADLADRMSTNEGAVELFTAHFNGNGLPHSVPSMTERELFEFGFSRMEFSWAEVLQLDEGCHRIKEWFERKMPCQT